MLYIQPCFQSNRKRVASINFKGKEGFFFLSSLYLSSFAEKIEIYLLSIGKTSHLCSKGSVKVSSVLIDYYLFLISIKYEKNGRNCTKKRLKHFPFPLYLLISILQ